MPNEPELDNEPQLEADPSGFLTLEAPFYLPRLLPPSVWDNLTRDASSTQTLRFRAELLADDQFYAALTDALRVSLEEQLS